MFRTTWLQQAARPDSIKKFARPALEVLEDRSVPATFGIPWRDPAHLTLSLAPDGTRIAGHQSDLIRLLSAQLPAAVWQREVARAFQTWANLGNISVGFTTDGGQEFGVAGLAQHDQRFGDIRIGGQAMIPDVLAFSAPPDPFLSGTLSGDVFVNTSVSYTARKLYSVLLHEAGHVFALPDNDDPSSIMYRFFDPQRDTLSAGDRSALQALYGVRAPDTNGRTFDTATRMRFADGTGGFRGQTPVVVYGDITRPGDQAFFWLRPFSGYTGPVTVRVQSRGVSFLAPRLTVYDEQRRIVGASVQSTNPLGDVISVRIPQVTRQMYFVKVEGATGDEFATGRYSMSVTFDANLQTDPALQDRVMRGPYDSLTPEDLQQVFRNPNGVFFNYTTGDGDFSTATPLQNRRGYPNNVFFADFFGSLPTPGVTHFYTVRAPNTPGPLYLTVTLSAIVDFNPTTGRVLVFDQFQNPVAVDVILNGNGTYVIQAANVPPDVNYFLKVVSDPRQPSPLGNYTLEADFGGMADIREAIASRTLDATTAQEDINFYAAHTQYFLFILPVQDGPDDAFIRMRIYDSSNNLIYTLATPAGDTASSAAVLLTPGPYTVRFSNERTAGDLVALTYRLRGTNLTDPIGVVPGDTTQNPMYECPNDPSMFCYPGGRSSAPFFFGTSGGQAPVASGGGRPGDKTAFPEVVQIAPLPDLETALVPAMSSPDVAGVQLTDLLAYLDRETNLGSPILRFSEVFELDILTTI